MSLCLQSTTADYSDWKSHQLHSCSAETRKRGAEGSETKASEALRRGPNEIGNGEKFTERVKKRSLFKSLY